MELTNREQGRMCNLPPPTVSSRISHRTAARLGGLRTGTRESVSQLPQGENLKLRESRSQERPPFTRIPSLLTCSHPMVHNHHPFIRPGPRIIVGLAILTALVFISQYIAAPSDEPGTPDRTPRSSQALLSFVDSFPEMRDREARGRPGMAHGDAGIAEFDWPGTRSMFVL